MDKASNFFALQWNPFLEATPLERPFDNVNLNKKVLISTPYERPSLLKDHFSCTKGVSLHCILKLSHAIFKFDVILSGIMSYFKVQR